MNYIKALGSGLAGALSVTLINESVRRFVPNAPRLDLLGSRAVEKSASAMGYSLPSSARYPVAIAGDLLSNSLYYSMSGVGKEKNTLLKGALLGLAAGVGAVALPDKMGLGEQPTNKTGQTQLLTVAYYLIGGLVTAATARFLTDRFFK
ncbi:hypothetical protein [Xanthocytophaga agilis]|uniref:Uncharacterized protein n=1 Tax=Xanthocytophaga agilis TaxID=3048010 RepID=A0AAE3RAJ8_9BACT|nr:hypothetical protein [Xanthocytophaga agilis]MDJ1503812.1 hypothetical protein [Xanthocytophaga agilis]